MTPTQILRWKIDETDDPNKLERLYLRLQQETSDGFHNRPKIRDL